MTKHTLLLAVLSLAAGCQRGPGEPPTGVSAPPPPTDRSAPRPAVAAQGQAPPVPKTPPGDPYETDWRSDYNRADRKELWEKSRKAVEELKAAKIRAELTGIGTSEATISDEAGTEGGKIKPEIFQLLRVMGVDTLNLRYFPLMTDEGMKQLAGLRCLKHLKASAPLVTDAGLIGLKPLASLERVEFIKMSGVKGDGFRYLDGCSKLVSLWVEESGLTDAGLAGLAGLKGLTSLYLLDNKLTDAGLIKLRSLSRLETLSLQGKITDAGVAAISTLPLQDLSLIGSELTDAGVAAISKIKGLRELDLTAVPLTDAGLKAIASLPNLEKLEVEGEKLSAAGVNAMAASPKLKRIKFSSLSPDAKAAAGQLKAAKPLLEVSPDGR